MDGVVVLRYDPVAGDPPLAARAIPVGPLEVVVPAVLAARRGWSLRCEDDRFAAALVAAGAKLRRRAHRYRRLLGPQDTGPADHGRPATSLLDATPAELAALAARAYPPGHPDHLDATGEDAEADFAALLAGTQVGPCLGAACHQVRDGARLVGACIVNRNGEPGPAGEAWVSDVFRDPDPAYRGVGTALLEAAIAALARQGDASLGLVVTDGNPARARYEALGFRLLGSQHTLAL